MAKSELGSKHKCQNCGTKFFDLNKDPVVCPKCGEVQQVAATPSPVRASPRAAAKDDEDVESEEGAEVVSLEDADDTDDGKVAAVNPEADDIEEDDNAGGDDDAFLEEDEEDDSNVSNLIDGDIEDDEER